MHALENAGMIDNRFLQHCPVGCAVPLVATAVRLPEGPLLRCGECGQLISQATPERYHRSMQEFDTARGTAPADAAEARRLDLARRRIERLQQLTGTASGSLRLR